MNEALAERASAIRHYLRDHADQPTAKRYSFLAARWEQVKLAQLDGKTTPSDDATFRELTSMLEVVTKRLFGREALTYRNGFLPHDPQRIVSDSWIECARLWFDHAH
jgi:hypothetical protein